MPLMLIGRVFRDGPGWCAFCDAIGAYTQGFTRKEAIANLVELVELKVDRKGFAARVTEVGGESVYVDSVDIAPLAAEVLKYQRGIHGLSLSDVARKLGGASRKAYAAYEQGGREPTLSKYLELLGAVAPEMGLMVGPTMAPGRARRKARTRRR